jgi:DNA polymerase-3 subunit delta
VKNIKEITALNTNIVNRNFDPVYFFHGEEAYYIDQFTDLIENTAIPEQERDFNQIVLYGSDVSSVSQIVSYAKEFPMMSERRVVIVKEAQLIQDFNRNAEILAKYIKNPQASTVLVIAYKHKKVDKRKAFFKSLKGNATVLESPKLYESELVDWVTKKVKKLKLNITPRANALIVEHIGSDLSTLNNQLNKLSSILNPGDTIEPELIEEYIGISKDYNNFELLSAIATANVAKANKIVQQFAQNPKLNPIQLTISSIFSYFTKLIFIHSNKSLSPSQYASELKVHTFFINEYLNAARIYDLRKSVRVISYLRDADMLSKGVGASKIESYDILKELIYKIMH